ncbi:MAG: CHASE2 domain-containing protein, partial [Chthoniobacterales bacterium]
MRIRNAKILGRGLTALAGSALAIGFGLIALRDGAPLARLSYDLPFFWRGASVYPSEVVIVVLDDNSATQLHQTPGAPWNRAIHTQLIDRLTQDQARLAFF